MLSRPTLDQQPLPDSLRRINLTLKDKDTASQSKQLPPVLPATFSSTASLAWLGLHRVRVSRSSEGSSHCHPVY